MFNEWLKMPPCSTVSTAPWATPPGGGCWRQLDSGAARITDLAAPLPISFAAVARHVAVLEQAGLIERDVRGREHWLSVRAGALTDAERWIAQQTAFWGLRADALADHLAQTRA